MLRQLAHVVVTGCQTVHTVVAERLGFSLLYVSCPQDKIQSHSMSQPQYAGVLISPKPELLPNVFCLMVRIFCLMLVLLYV